jgi:hypothetical protein
MIETSWSDVYSNGVAFSPAASRRRQSLCKGSTTRSYGMSSSATACTVPSSWALCWSESAATRTPSASSKGCRRGWTSRSCAIGWFKSWRRIEHRRAYGTAATRYSVPTVLRYPVRACVPCCCCIALPQRHLLPPPKSRARRQLTRPSHPVVGAMGNTMLRDTQDACIWRRGRRCAWTMRRHPEQGIRAA